MPFELSVPYADKDKVKSLGAFWVPRQKAWVIPDHVQDINRFNRWIPFNEGCIVRKPYLVCLSKTNCWKCGKETPMIALGATNYFTFEPEEKLWFKAPEPTLFSSVITLDKHVLDYLQVNYPFFKRMYSYTAEDTCYKNTCIACGRLQGDFYHHDEPGGAFFPDPLDSGPTNIILKNIELGFDYYINGSYGGMAYDDIFYPEKRQQLVKQGLKVHILKS